MPAVSVILPTYNRASLIEKTIQSVLSQSHSDFELIILDDGSTDCTADIVAKLSDRRIRFIRHETNIGFTANWTYGVRSVRGEFISILGDDDLYKPNFLKNRMQAFKNYPELCAVTGAFDCCDLHGTITRKSLLPCLSDKLFSDRELINLSLGFSGEWFNGATLYRTAAVQTLWDEIVFARTTLDLTLHILLSLKTGAKVLFLTESDMFLRVHAGQESINNNFYLSESAAIMAMKLWHFKIKPARRYRDLFRKRFSADISHYARILWDKGMILESRAMFQQELFIDPFNPKTWLRLLRTFLS
jgi:glycosyltransferase involved in cell wall biosynthesis